jgi:hypothetical protein
VAALAICPFFPGGCECCCNQHEQILYHKHQRLSI